MTREWVVICGECGARTIVPALGSWRCGIDADHTPLRVEIAQP